MPYFLQEIFPSSLSSCRYNKISGLKRKRLDEARTQKRIHMRKLQEPFMRVFMRSVRATLRTALPETDAKRMSAPHDRRSRVISKRSLSTAS